MNAAAMIETLSRDAARMLAVEILLADPESLHDDVLGGQSGLLRPMGSGFVCHGARMGLARAPIGQNELVLGDTRPIEVTVCDTQPKKSSLVSHTARTGTEAGTDVSHV